MIKAHDKRGNFELSALSRKENVYISDYWPLSSYIYIYIYIYQDSSLIQDQ